MLTIPLDSKSSVYLYEQIYEYIKKEILSGNLPCHTKLPSVRSLADYHSISRNTVDLAYAQLVSEGYVDSVKKKGYYVTATSTFPSYPDILPTAASSGLPSAQANLTASGPAYCQKETLLPSSPSRTANVSSPRDGERPLIDFSPFSVDLSHFPYATWRQLSKQVLLKNQDLFLSGHHQGDPDFRKAISAYLYQARGVSCDISQIIVGAGVDYLLQLLVNILGPSHAVAMENPVYKRAEGIFRSFGMEIYPISLDQQGLVASCLKDTPCKLAYVTPSHQYPLGTVMSISRRNELLSWADQPERYIIEDDHDSEFRYKGRPIPSLKSIAVKDNVIYIGTFSRAIAPAIRVGYMVLPESLLAVYHKKCGFYACTVSRFDQAILTRFIENGYFERHLNRMRKVYKTKHDFFLSLLKKQPYIRDISGENAGMHFVAAMQTTDSEEHLVKKAASYGVRCYGLKEHFLRVPEPYAPTFLFGYANLTEEEMVSGLSLIQQAGF